MPNWDTGKASKSLLQKVLCIGQVVQRIGKARRIGLHFSVQKYTGAAHREGAVHRDEKLNFLKNFIQSPQIASIGLDTSRLSLQSYFPYRFDDGLMVYVSWCLCKTIKP